jgi:RNA polymerase sigma-70 factor, ECF subfamily
VGAHEAAGGVGELVAIYDRALPQVYGYLLPRSGSVAAAEDITAETLLAAVDALERSLVAAGARSEVDDPWPSVIDTEAIHAALARLSAPHRTALVLRYLDGLSVAEVADCVGRSLHATETLLVRARSALRRLYLQEDSDGC